MHVMDVPLTQPTQQNDSKITTRQLTRAVVDRLVVSGLWPIKPRVSFQGKRKLQILMRNHFVSRKVCNILVVLVLQITVMLPSLLLFCWIK